MVLGHNPERPYVCPVCHKGFKRKEHLNLHAVIHSGLKTEVSLSTKFAISEIYFNDFCFRFVRNVAKASTERTICENT